VFVAGIGGALQAVRAREVVINLGAVAPLALGLLELPNGAIRVAFAQTGERRIEAHVIVLGFRQVAARLVKLLGFCVVAERAVCRLLVFGFLVEERRVAAPHAQRRAVRVAREQRVEQRLRLLVFAVLERADCRTKVGLLGVGALTTRTRRSARARVGGRHRLLLLLSAAGQRQRED
jgi:hypothetical protein